MIRLLALAASARARGELSQHESDALGQAYSTERAAARFRRAGISEVTNAITHYDEASTAYADTGLAFHGRGESELADEVRRAIKRCQAKASNLRHPPKPQRPEPPLPRGKCENCSKVLRRYRLDGQTWRDGTPRVWGLYGDNRFCGLTCGWQWALKHRAPR